MAEALTRIAYVREDSGFQSADATLWGGILIEGSSQSVVDSMSGKSWDEPAHRAELRDECLSLLEEIGLPWHAQWITRRANLECYSLARSPLYDSITAECDARAGAVGRKC